MIAITRPDFGVPRIARRVREASCVKRRRITEFSPLRFTDQESAAELTCIVCEGLSGCLRYGEELIDHRKKIGQVEGFGQRLSGSQTLRDMEDIDGARGTSTRDRQHIDLVMVLFEFIQCFKSVFVG